jgi:hypothetical protein
MPSLSVHVLSAAAAAALATVSLKNGVLVVLALLLLCLLCLLLPGRRELRVVHELELWGGASS